MPDWARLQNHRRLMRETYHCPSEFGTVLLTGCLLWQRGQSEGGVGVARLGEVTDPPETDAGDVSLCGDRTKGGVWVKECEGGHLPNSRWTAEGVTCSDWGHHRWRILKREVRMKACGLLSARKVVGAIVGSVRVGRCHGG